MASLGNLFFEILYRDDPKQLEEIKKRALAQLKDIEVKVNARAGGSAKGSSSAGAENAERVTAETKAYIDLKNAIENISNAYSEEIRRLTELRQLQKDVRSEIAALNKIKKEEGFLTSEQVASLERLTNEELQYKQAIAETTRTINVGIKEEQAKIDSMTEMGNTLARLKMEYRNLSEAERNSPAGEAMHQQISKLDKEFKSLNASIGNFQGNVGNYASAFDALDPATSSIDELTASLNRLKAEYSAMTAEQRNSPIGVKMQADIQAADAELQKLNKTMKSSAGSVSGFNKMQWETNQLMRELPALAYGPNIFFGAISNNLPMFIDGLKSAHKEYKDFIALQKQGIATGKAVQPVWKQLAATLVSWQTIMIVAITVLTKYGREIIDFARNVSSAVKAQREMTKALKEAKGEYADATKELAEMQALIKNVDGTFVTSKEVLDKYNESLGKVFGEATSVAEAEQLLIDNTPAYLKAMIQKMKANAVLAEMQKESGKAASLRLKAEEKEVTLWDKISESFKAASRGEVARGVNGETWEDFVRRQWNAAADVAEEKAEDMGKAYLEIMEKYYKDAKDSGLDLFSGKETKDGNKTLEDRVKLLVEANEMYKKWVILRGEEIALGKANFIVPGFDPTTLRKQLQDLAKQGNEKERESAVRALLGLDEDIINSVFETTERKIKSLVSKWDLFADLKAKSGDHDFAMNAVFGVDIGFTSALDEMQLQIEAAIQDDSNGLSFSELIKLDETEITKRFGKGVLIMVKAYQEESKKLSDESLMRAAELLNTYKNYEQQRKDIITQSEQDIADLIANGASQDAVDEATKRMNESLASLDFKEFKESGEWAMVFDDLDRYATNALDSVMVKLEEFANTTGKDLPINEFKELVNAIKKLRGEVESRNPFKALAEGLKEYSKASKINDPKAKADAQAAAIGKIKNAFNEATPALQTFSSAFGELGSMFDALGNEKMANVMGYAEMAVGSITNIGEGFAKGGIVGGIGAAVGEAAKWVGKLAGDHDEKLDKAIQKSQMEVQKLQGLYENIERSLKRSLGNVNNLYRRQKQLLEQQKKELEKQKKAEESKKKSDKSKVEDYKKEIDEINDQVKYFAEDLANDLYGIDLKGWAAQLGDALFDAWKKGESGAEAFEKTAAEILGNVMNDVLKISILEPMMNDVRTALFGSDGKGGYFGSDYSLDTNEMSQLAQILMKGEKKSEAYYEALDGLNDYMEKNYGVSLKDKKSKKGLSAGIKGITEDTADILASLVNSIRADQARTVEAITRYVNDFAPEMNTIVKAQLERLINIAENTKKSADLTEEIRDLFSAVVSGTKQVKIK